MWCPLLQAPNLHGYLCVDELGRGHLASFASWAHAHAGRPLCAKNEYCGEFELREEEDRRKSRMEKIRRQPHHTNQGAGGRYIERRQLYSVGAELRLTSFGKLPTENF